jgi:hypothetical protein
MALEIFKYNRIQFEQLYEDARDYLTTKFLQVGDVFSPASAYGQLLSVMIDLGKLIFYYVEDSITELNIYTATRNVSIRSLARIAGHNPTRAIAATGSLKFTYNGASVKMYGNTIIIPNYTKLINNATGLTYTITADTEDIRMNLTGSNSVAIKVTQGVVESQTVTGTGIALQSYPINPKKGAQVDNFYVKVYVNAEQWRLYDSIYDMPYQSKGVVVKTGISGGIDLYFGNGFFGKIPDLGSSIRIEYITTAGNAGNIFLDDSPQFKFSDDVFDVTGEVVEVNEAINITLDKEVVFGADAEPVLLTKVLAPKTSRAYVLANADSYVYFLEKFNIFSVIDAFSTFDDNDITDDNVVYLFLIPDVNKRKANNADYFSVPVNLFTLTQEEKDKVYKFIEESGQKIVTTLVKIIDPVIKRYVININVTAFEGYSKDAIRQEIISKCSDYFLKNRRRDRIPRSDLISIIESVAGVDTVNLWFVSEENEVFKSNQLNANEPDKGLDSFGDVIIGRGEYALIRGGWYGRPGPPRTVPRGQIGGGVSTPGGIFYSDSTSPDKPCSINIAFGKDTPKTLNMDLHRINIDSIKNG